MFDPTFNGVDVLLMALALSLAVFGSYAFRRHSREQALAQHEARSPIEPARSETVADLDAMGRQFDTMFRTGEPVGGGRP